MSTVEAIFKFLANYPVWAKVAMLAGLMLTGGVALLAPKTPLDAEAQTKSGGAGNAVLFKIHGVTSSGLPPSASVRVMAIVNGKALTYPSLGAVDWLGVGPTMSSQSFSLPNATKYEIRFEMEVKGGPRYVSQETIQVATLPHTGEYRLYPTMVDSGGVSRAAKPGAFVRFSLEAGQ